MAIVGKIMTEEVIIPAREKDRRICDICGADATDRVPCMRCKKDICDDHFFDVYRMAWGHYRPEEELSGIYCKECLIAEINKR